jgi:fermentation-respiration switch protein FrsA (DUF1100 family)
VRSPILLLAGSEDRYTRIAESREMFARARSPKEFWEVEGAAHVDLHRFAPAEYERRVGIFLERNLARPAEQRPVPASMSSGSRCPAP